MSGERQPGPAFAYGWISAALNALDARMETPDGVIESMRALRAELRRQDPTLADCPISRPLAQ